MRMKWMDSFVLRVESQHENFEGLCKCNMMRVWMDIVEFNVAQIIHKIASGPCSIWDIR